MFQRERKLKFLPHTQKVVVCALPPFLSLITSPTFSPLLVPTSMIYLVMDGLNSGALKLNQAFVNMELWDFSPITLKNLLVINPAGF